MTTAQKHHDNLIEVGAQIQAALDESSLTSRTEIAQLIIEEIAKRYKKGATRIEIAELLALIQYPCVSKNLNRLDRICCRAEVFELIMEGCEEIITD